jgi:hypothetical protein
VITFDSLYNYLNKKNLYIIYKINIVFIKKDNHKSKLSLIYQNYMIFSIVFFKLYHYVSLNFIHN